MLAVKLLIYIYIITVIFRPSYVGATEVDLSLKKIENPKIGYICFLFYIGIYI